MPKQSTKKGPSEEERAEFRKRMQEMMAARIEMFAASSVKYAEALGTFRAALQKSGFSAEESMQIILKVAEEPGRRPMFGAWQSGEHWGRR